MKFSRYISFFFILLALVCTSCVDDLLYDATEIGDGEADLNVRIEFHSLEPALDTRAAGNAVNKIDKLWLVIYKVNGAGGEEGLYEKLRIYDSDAHYEFPGLNIDQAANSTVPGDAETVTPSDNQNVGPADGTISGTGEKTPSATFSLDRIPYGRYKMFVVANVDLTDVDCTTINDLRGKRFDWQTNVSLDNQMFGYVTLESEDKSAGFDAPSLVINKPSVSVHSWIKRLVSKVTVSFDGSELKENVRVYIKSVTIHDIPASCALGENNTPNKEDELIKNGESFTYYKPGEDGNVNHEKWDIVISKGEPFGGQTGHTESDNSLYFYENMQGNYPDDPSMDKRQDPDAVGTPIDEYKPGNDYKDKKLYGTYIEVVGYYDSRHKDKISQGPIKYRFMLGKNSTFNYDAERNYHYKLTLKFRGWANEADWHISYKEYTPTLITPEPYYISYLYKQEMDFPARVILPDTWDKTQYYIKAEIVENNWWPWELDEKTKTGKRPDQFVGSQTDENGFAWNEPALTYNYPEVIYTKGSPEPYSGGNYVGFLSLRDPGPDIIGNDKEVNDATHGLDSNGYGEHANEYLEGYYKSHNLAINEYGLTGANAAYDEIDKSVHVKIPMYTRNKEMVPATDFSGNNPFNCYYRYAKVRFTLWQKTGSGDKQITFKNEDGEDETERLATIYQVPRIENPTAIYRDAGSVEEFEIKLMIRPRADATEFVTFKSDGPWCAYVERDPEGFIELYDRNGVKRDRIEGSTDEDIVFKYKPKGPISDDQTRCGIIKVEYHDNNCVHLIFVRQGYHKGVQLGDATWSCYNVYATSRGSTDNERNSYEPSKETSVPVVLTKSPLSIGSVLKRNQYNYSIREWNVENRYGWLKPITGALSTAYIDGNKNVKIRNANWSDIQGHGWTNYKGTNNNIPTQERYTYEWADEWIAVGEFRSNEKFTVPSADNYKSLLATCKFGYGIVYADGATTTQTKLTEAWGYTDFDNQGSKSTRGIRACIVYDDATGRNVIFPLGPVGQARRARTAPGANGVESPFKDNPPTAGSLSYGGVSSVLGSDKNRYRPLTYNLYRNTGAVYWIKKPVTIPGTSTTKAPIGLLWPDYASWDINYYNLVFNPYDYGSLGNWSQANERYNGMNAESSSDALPIKLIYK